MIVTQNYRSIAESIQKRYANNIPKIKIQNKILGTLSTIHKRDPYNPNYITTELRNSYNKIVGKEVFYFDEKSENSAGLSIEVHPEYRQKGFNFGEVLRLSSIMMILENKIKNFEIFSKHTAIYFHSKYKFEPAIVQFKERNSALESIIKNCKDNKDYQEFYSEAKDLLEKANQQNSDAEAQRRLCKDTNKLLKRYISKVFQKKDEYKKHPFTSGITMKLTLDNINTHKSFFNDLFEKHSIDYKI